MTKIDWAGAAKDDYLDLLEQTYERSVDAALELDDKLEALLDNLQRFKHFCPPTGKFPRFRRCVVTKFISLVYETGKHSVLIISVFDTRGRSPFV